MVGPIINGTDGTKMSSSKGNVIALTMSPADMFGACMSIHDDLIIEYCMVLTRMPMEHIALFQHQLDSGVNPRDIKMKLAHTLVTMYHGADEATRAEDGFVAQFSRHELPDTMPDVSPSAHDIVTVLLDAGMASSRSDARRLIEQGGIRVNQHQVQDLDHVVIPGDVVSRGKLQFVRVV